MSAKSEIKEIYGKLQISNDNEKWYTIYTKYRHEKKVARKCVDYDIPYYLPLQDSIKHYEHRIITFKKPLFPGYIFCKCDKSGKKQLYQTGYICKFIETLNQMQLVNELQQIYGITQKSANLLPYSYLKRGKKVRVVNGPFTGFEGKISHRKGEYRLVLNIELIKQAVAVEINSNDVAPL